MADQKSGTKQLAKSGSRKEDSAHALLYSAPLNGELASAASPLMRQELAELRGAEMDSASAQLAIDVSCRKRRESETLLSLIFSDRGGATLVYPMHQLHRGCPGAPGETSHWQKNYVKPHQPTSHITITTLLTHTSSNATDT